MPKLLPALLAIFFLVGCAQSSVEPSETEENQTVDNFERNLECQNYKKELNTKFPDNPWVSSVFYSPKIGACVYIKETLLQTSTFNAESQSFEIIEDGSSWRKKELINLFTEEKLAVSNSGLVDDFFADFDQKIKEYQN
jgi:hypothetical protein